MRRGSSKTSRKSRRSLTCLLRPIPKWAIYTIKLLATMTTTVVLVVVFIGLTYAAIYVGGEVPMGVVAVRWLKASLIGSLSVVTYCSLFGLLSFLTSRILVVGILYIAVVEGLLANFPFSIRLVTVIYYARLIAYHAMTFQVPRPRGGTEDAAAIAWQLGTASDPNLTEHPSLATCILILLGASLVFTVIAAWLCVAARVPREDAGEGLNGHGGPDPAFMLARGGGQSRDMSAARTSTAAAGRNG